MSSTLVAKTTTHTPPSSATTATTTSTTTYSLLARPQLGSQFAQPPPPRSLRKATSHTNNRVTANTGASASTPNLNSLYNSHSRFAPPLAPLPPIPDSTTSSAGDVHLSRKGSLAALTPSSLAAIPDASESYGLNTVLSQSSPETRKMAPATPGRGGAGAGVGDDLSVGDRVEVPGNMHGTVRFVGSVQGKKGTFAGVELHPDFATRGKNSGDVDGVSYFTTSTPGAGIFLPLAKAVRKDPPPPDSAGTSLPFTPSASTIGLKAGNQNSTNHTPPTPSLPKFSQSVGPGRAPSPQMKRPRPSLPRPESPVRRLMTPGPRPSMGAASPAPKPPSRYGSPSVNRFAQSVRGTAGDPNKKSRTERQPSVGPRSASALGQTSGFTDDESTPVGTQRNSSKANGSNGSVGSVSSFSSRFRPASRANNNNDDEVERLRGQLEQRDKQLREQAATLAEMESSLTEVQALMDGPEGLRQRRNSLDDKDSSQLRAMLREKNEKIAMLTAEFDAHRADFRSTIDTLEMASTETERVYEKRIEELQQEIRDLESRTDDVDSVAQQLKQLEELVQELEEGLEDARRGEAEARGEVEFLRGEVERTRTELKREREKASSSSPGTSASEKNSNVNNKKHLSGNGGSSASKELECKEDEIRGLKAIIHSLSRDSVPGSDTTERPYPSRTSSFNKTPAATAVSASAEPADARSIRERMEKEMTELRAMVDNSNRREEELQREVETLRRASLTNGNSGSAKQRSSFRDSRDTIVLARNSHHAPPRPHSRVRDSRSPEALKRAQPPPPALDPMAESDTYSTATETSTLWCEICETGGHDVLTCTEMFGEGAARNNGVAAAAAAAGGGFSSSSGQIDGGGLKRHQDPRGADLHDHDKPAPLLSPRSKSVEGTTPTAHIIPNPLESGPVAGKDSQVVDESKWCALCERDGHDSVDCPFEDAF